MFSAVAKFDVSRVIATIGATQPILIFILTCIFWGPQILPPMDILAFVILIIGSVIISIEKNAKITGDFLKISLLSSLMYALDYVFAKFVFINETFLPGIIWIGIFAFLVACVFLFKKSFRKEIFEKETVGNKKTQKFFVLAQISGGTGVFLQNFAISLAPIAFLATMNSLRGIQYVFLFLMTLFLSFFFPRILKEEISRRIIFQKVISIGLIAIGLAVLVIY